METSVIVVHGVGDPLPGNALDKLIQGLSVEQWTQVEGTWIEHRHEAGQSDPSDKEVRTFPVARATLRKTEESGIHTLHLREVYWGDLSRPKASLFGLVSAMFDLIFGLRYIVAAATSQLVGPARYAGQLAQAALWIARGPMFALNILAASICACYVLFTSLKWHWNLSWSIQPPLAAILVTSLVVALIGSIVHCSARRLEWSPTTGTCMVLLGIYSFVAGWVLHPDLKGNLDIFIGKAGSTGGGAFEITTLMVGGASIMAFCALASLLICGWYYIRSSSSRRSLIVVSVCMGLSLGIFTFVVIALWTIIGRVVREDTADRIHRCLLQLPVWLEHCFDSKKFQTPGTLLAQRIEAGIHLLPWLVGGFVVMGLLYLGIVLANWLMSKCASRSSDERLRYIVSPAVVVVCVGITVSMGCAFLLLFRDGWLSEELRSWLKNDAAKPIALAFTALIISVVLATQSHFLTALDLVLDVIAHFRTDDYAGYFRRKKHVVWERIIERFRCVLDSEICRSDGTRAVVVVSHSLGTMIAADGLGALKVGQFSDRRKKSAAYGRVHLVTMGSPITYLFKFYLPTRYHYLPSAVRKWLNIYRIDDFIGTKMDVDEVGDVNVGLGGHANYWSDSRIVPHILAAIHTEAERKAEIQLGDALAR